MDTMKSEQQLHEDKKALEAFGEIVRNLDATTTTARNIMDSGVLNDSLKGYVVAALNDSESLDHDQRKEVMNSLRYQLSVMTAKEAAAYYEEYHLK